MHPRAAHAEADRELEATSASGVGSATHAVMQRPSLLSGTGKAFMPRESRLGSATEMHLFLTLSEEMLLPYCRYPCLSLHRPIRILHRKACLN